MLVADEPAEHLEAVASDALTADLLEVTEGRSLVLITHRLAGLESVDEILVMEAGRVVERGTHDTLLDQGGWYSRSWWEEMSASRNGVTDEGNRGRAQGPRREEVSVPNGGRTDRRPSR